MKAFKMLRIRLAVICTAGTTLVLGLMALYSYAYSVNQFRGQNESAFERDLNNIFYTLGTQDVISQNWLYQTESGGNLLIGVESAGYQSRYSQQTADRAELLELVKHKAVEDYGFNATARPTSALQPDLVTFTVQTQTGSYRAAVARLDVGDSFLGVTVLKDMDMETQQIARLRTAYLLGVVVSTLFLAAFAWFFSSWASRPIKDSNQRQADFISAVSHELRSPLSVIQANLEMIKEAPPEDIGEFADTSLKECGRLNRLTNDMLRLVRADGQSWELKPEKLAPEEILLDSLAAYDLLAEEHGIRLTTVLPEQPLPEATLDKGRMLQVMTILLDNAMRYTPEGGEIRISVQKEGRFLLFRVADSGVGIPEEKRSRIFDRFYRGDESRTDKEHYGLGLSIAMEIVHLHGGDMFVDDSDLGGAEFVIKLPL